LRPRRQHAAVGPLAFLRAPQDGLDHAVQFAVRVGQRLAVLQGQHDRQAVAPRFDERGRALQDVGPFPGSGPRPVAKGLVGGGQRVVDVFHRGQRQLA